MLMAINHALFFNKFLLQSEIGFGKMESYTKLDKLGEVSFEYVLSMLKYLLHEKYFINLKIFCSLFA